VKEYFIERGATTFQALSCRNLLNIILPSDGIPQHESIWIKELPVRRRSSTYLRLLSSKGIHLKFGARWVVGGVLVLRFRIKAEQALKRFCFGKLLSQLLSVLYFLL
jgi:hypothetical protein